MNRLDEIEARANAATEGPWEVGDRYHCVAADTCDCRQDYGPLIDTYQHPEWGTMHVHRTDEPWWHDGVLYRPAGGSPGEVCRDTASADAEFIAHARTDVPALVAALRAVLELHAPTPSDIYPHDVCHHPHCTDPTDQMEQSPWPCPTVTAIRQHLGEDA